MVWRACELITVGKRCEFIGRNTRARTVDIVETKAIRNGDMSGQHAISDLNARRSGACSRHDPCLIACFNAKPRSIFRVQSQRAIRVFAAPTKVAVNRIRGVVATLARAQGKREF